MYRFNYDKTLVLYVSPDNRLTLWDVATNRLKQTYKERAHLTAGYTCVSYRSAPTTDDASSLSSFGIAALGSDTGAVIIWDFAKDTFRRVAHEKSKFRVADVALTGGADRVFTCSEKSKFVYEWDLASGEIIREFVGGKPGVSRLALSPSGRRLLTSGPNIRLWDLESGDKLKRFVGHASAATQLVFVDEEHFVSACDDRFMSVWTCSKGSKGKEKKEKTRGVPLEKKPLFVLAAPSVPVDIAVKSTNARACRVVVCTSTEVFAWDMDIQRIAQSAQVSVEPTFVVKSSGCATAGLKTEKQCHLLRIVGDHHELRLVELNAIFEQTGKVIVDSKRSTVVSAESEMNGNAKQVEAVVAASEKSEENEAPTEKNRKVNAEDLTKQVPLATSQDKSSSLTDQRPMGERVKEMSTKLSKLTEELLMNGETDASNQSKKRKRQPETAASLSSALEQALQSNDLDMIEACINQSDQEIIGTTVGRLPPSRILQFVGVLVQKYEARPSRSRILFAWIEAILKQHAAFLITVPDLTATLGGLYESVKSRARLLDKFVQLSGRLDFIVSQVDIQAQSKLLNGEPEAEKQSETGEATITYDEEA